MNLYTTRVSQPLPDWAIIVFQEFGLFELEINHHHPDYQSLFNGLTSEILPGVVGVKASDLCTALVDRCGDVGSVPVTNVLV